MGSNFMSEEVRVYEDESVDDLFKGNLKIIQKKYGYRFSVDALLLANFVISSSAKTIIELGTGSGIILLILARKMEFKKMIGVEVQEDLAEIAQRNIKLNNLRKKISILKDDYRNLKRRLKPSSFDLVLSNPPYYRVDAGRMNPAQQKAIARHELRGSLDDLLEICSYLVSSSGQVALIYPAFRLVDLLAKLREHQLEVKIIQMVHSKRGGEGKLVLIKARKEGGGEMEIFPPFFIYQPGGEYSEEMKKVHNLITL